MPKKRYMSVFMYFRIDVLSCFLCLQTLNFKLAMFTVKNFLYLCRLNPQLVTYYPIHLSTVIVYGYYVSSFARYVSNEAVPLIHFVFEAILASYSANRTVLYLVSKLSSVPVLVYVFKS